jgi:hypothetical protein
MTVFASLDMKAFGLFDRRQESLHFVSARRPAAGQNWNRIKRRFL